jgi:hypothetical protein
MLSLCLSLLTSLTMFKKLLPIAGLFLLSSGLVQSAEWSLRGSVDQTLGYDDNVQMQKNGQGSFKYMIIPVLNFLHTTEHSEIQANASYGTQIYTEIPRFSQDFQNYGVNGLYKTERFDWRLSGNYSATPTRNNINTNGGNFTNAESDRWSVTPSATYRASENDNITLTPEYSQTTYSGLGQSTNLGNRFRNNEIFNVTLGWQRLWTERYTTTASIFYNNYNTQHATGNDSITFDSVGANLSNTYLWSENWNLHGTIGVRHTETTNGNSSTGSIGFLADIGVNYTGENFTTGIYFTRSLTPSNQGQLQEQTGVGLNFDYKILENLSASFITNYLESTFVSQGNSNPRDNIMVQPAITWQIAPEWSLSGNYRYRTQSLGINDAESNLFSISINYNWQGLKKSR